MTQTFLNEMNVNDYRPFLTDTFKTLYAADLNKLDRELMRLWNADEATSDSYKKAMSQKAALHREMAVLVNTAVITFESVRDSLIAQGHDAINTEKWHAYLEDYCYTKAMKNKRIEGAIYDYTIVEKDVAVISKYKGAYE